MQQVFFFYFFLLEDTAGFILLKENTTSLILYVCLTYFSYCLSYEQLGDLTKILLTQSMFCGVGWNCS